MLCIDNLIRLYYCYHGNFDGITKSSFGSEVLSQLDSSKYNDLTNYLYSVLGYKSNQLMEPSQIASLREEFCKKSYKADYMKSLQQTYKVKSTSELIDTLDSKGILGIQKRPVYTLGSKKGIVPSKFLNRYICDVLYLIESYLDNCSSIRNIDFTKVKLKVAINPNVEEVLKEIGFTYDDFFKVKYIDSNKVEFKDGIVYMKDTGYSELECREFLVKLYLLGMPTIPLYLRDKFISILPRCILFGTLDEVMLDFLDFSYVADCSPRKLLRCFGFDLPDPEELWRTYNGFFFTTQGKVYFSNRTSEEYLELSVEDFTNLVNEDAICDLDIKEVLYNRDLDRLQESNLF